MESFVNAHDAPELIEPEAYVFQELDHQRIGLGSESWIALVLGVHIFDREAWVQVAAQDRPSESVVVHIWPGTATRHVKLALWKWGQLPSTERPVVVDAGHVDVH